MIDFDSLTGIADEPYTDPDVAPVSGLIVAEKAQDGNDLVLESQAYVASSAGVPFVMFYEPSETDADVLVWANEGEWRAAMDRLTPVSEAEAIAWTNARISEGLEQWADRLDEAGL